MNLATLELTPEEQEKARGEIRYLAFEHWCEAGCPLCDPLEFWLPAERKWIETQYVPDRESTNQYASAAELGEKGKRS